MQRITRDATSPSPELLRSLENKVELLHRHFPPSVASLYATPRAGTQDTLQWWSELGGQPLTYESLGSTARQALLARYEQRQQAIRQLVDELKARGKTEESQALDTLIGAPDLDNLYSLNDEPVVVRWGLKPKAVPPVSSAAPTPPPVPLPIVPSTRWWLRIPLWLLLLPLLLLLLWLLWTWRGSVWNLIYPTPVESYACTANTPKPDFVVVLDTSGSMNININATAADEEWLSQTGQNLPETNPRKIRLLAEPTRMTVAKQSFAAMIDQLHPDIDTRLITFKGCTHTVDQGLFGRDARPQLIAGVNQLQADDGTPLAASLADAASKVDGRFKDAVVVMFVDGEDGCEQNACEVSARIASQQPRLRVNVVNISDSALSNCIAENTGGRVYAANNAVEVQRMLREAMDEVSNKPTCPGEQKP
ncbi:VWA domain-containing protein [Pseudomonas cichorii]|uniref:VWA domain-containing protein n=1 Tax=Pseudomonas cichorii TaxID=36746 RepID=UPI001C8A2FCF|nr:VWA domain-containing protein [Pseudomonas cichorii]MBX8513178.1 VWA domain-containing protein [Pseudomonas cichorii]